jgi:hypothetical protein
VHGGRYDALFVAGRLNPCKPRAAVVGPTNRWRISRLIGRTNFNEPNEGGVCDKQRCARPCVVVKTNQRMVHCERVLKHWESLQNINHPYFTTAITRRHAIGTYRNGIARLHDEFKFSCYGRALFLEIQYSTMLKRFLSLSLYLFLVISISTDKQK